MKKKTEAAYHHGDLRRALVDATAALLAEVDAGALSLRQVSERVGVSHAAAYRHFRDKDDLLAAVSEQGFSRLRLRTAAARSMEPATHRQKLSGMAKAYVDFAVEEPGAYRLMFGSGFLDRMTRSGVEQSAQLAFGELLGAVIDGQAAGEIRGGSPFLLSNTAWALLHGLALFYLEGQLDRDSRGPVTSRCWEFLWEGIGGANRDGLRAAT